MNINKEAPVIATAGLYIKAPVSMVWQVQTDLLGWPRWNRDVSRISVQGPFAVGTTFRWKAGGVEIVSRLEEIAPMHRIVWSGKTWGVHAIHAWYFESQDNGTNLVTEESLEGPVARFFPDLMRKGLTKTLLQALLSLKAECERRANTDNLP